MRPVDDVEDALGLFGDTDTSSIGGGTGGEDEFGHNSDPFGLGLESSSAATARSSVTAVPPSFATAYPPQPPTSGSRFEPLEIDLSNLRNRNSGSSGDLLTDANFDDEIDGRDTPPSHRDLEESLNRRLLTGDAAARIRLFPPSELDRAMYSRGSSVGSHPRETDALLTSDTGSASGNLTAYDDKHGGEYVFSRGGSVQVTKNSPHCFPVCCSIFSCLGVIYLVCLGSYALMDWTYFPEIWAPSKKSVVATNAFSAAALYFICLLVSLYYWRKQVNDQNYSRGFRRLERVHHE